MLTAEPQSLPLGSPPPRVSRGRSSVVFSRLGELVFPAILASLQGRMTPPRVDLCQVLRRNTSPPHGPEQVGLNEGLEWESILMFRWAQGRREAPVTGRRGQLRGREDG